MFARELTLSQSGRICGLAPFALSYESMAMSSGIMQLVGSHTALWIVAIGVAPRQNKIAPKKKKKNFDSKTKFEIKNLKKSPETSLNKKYHWHRNQSEARQYDFRINYHLNYESESESQIRSGGGVDEIHLKLVVMPKTDRN